MAAPASGATASPASFAALAGPTITGRLECRPMRFEILQQIVEPFLGLFVLQFVRLGEAMQLSENLFLLLGAEAHREWLVGQQVKLADQSGQLLLGIGAAHPAGHPTAHPAGHPTAHPAGHSAPVGLELGVGA